VPVHQYIGISRPSSPLSEVVEGCLTRVGTNAPMLLGVFCVEAPQPGTIWKRVLRKWDTIAWEKWLTRGLPTTPGIAQICQSLVPLEVEPDDDRMTPIPLRPISPHDAINTTSYAHHCEDVFMLFLGAAGPLPKPDPPSRRIRDSSYKGIPQSMKPAKSCCSPYSMPCSVTSSFDEADIQIVIADFNGGPMDVLWTIQPRNCKSMVYINRPVSNFRQSESTNWPHL